MNKNSDTILDVNDKPGFWLWVGLSLQHMFSMFGSTVIVPLLVGLSPSIALFTSGVGTLIHILVTQKKIPAYMGSSFAFIVPMKYLMQVTGYPGIAQGVIAVGVIYLVVALIVAMIGSEWIDKLLPAVVVGPVVIVIGLSLASSAANDAMLNNGNYDYKYVFVALITLLLAIFFNMYLKGFLGFMPILLAIVCGYVLSIAMGLVNLSTIANAPWFAMPKFEIPFVSYNVKFEWGAIIAIAPIAFVTITEHLGHLMVLDELTGRNYFKDPGLNRTLTGDGLASMFAGLVGGPAVTSYGENIGAMAITKIHSVYVLIGAAVFAILFSFVNKLNVLIMQMPLPVIGGISFLLFGTIASSGIKIMIENQIDLANKRNLMIVSTILVIGVGGFMIKIGTLPLNGLAVSVILGILLNIVLPKN
ncbi:uracil permease [Apilactobacillus kunkeei]|uniref:uracil-xanthine permease family protein n=1 Tax=Apilactobacillus kunkeei TaxID=148814 RepID=UPI00059AFA7A|nr:solute carrier family 23 protein [Apilactobacillus kunkeei]MBI0090971.1 uracil permease [Lactobacillus sp. M0345]KIM19223.1 uracil permease [Apilactobacillus kunkeei]MBX8455698.1 NCS2 family nucleobase:cation symporter [Apilactobacillus kunkeei]MCK8618374.1 NCS2 family nucleobase:cation symporter [Apilactobacillus kunkeei]QYU53896.1 NCS2 family nucleobase:cation symporter [Apilactobacillus kunkeei]